MKAPIKWGFCFYKKSHSLKILFFIIQNIMSIFNIIKQHEYAIFRFSLPSRFKTTVF
jgi:hypothetical protein